jgi:hypothetical protein
MASKDGPQADTVGMTFSILKLSYWTRFRPPTALPMAPDYIKLGPEVYFLRH